MNTPEWGAMFFDNAVQRGAKMYWGARGAIRFSKYDLKRFLDLYPDRQSFVADDTHRKEEFVDWLNHHAIPYLEKRVTDYSTSHIECSSKDDHFHCIAEDRNSGGYLYIGAWEE